METAPAATGAGIAFGAGVIVLIVIVGVLAVITLICWILEFIAAFKHEESPLMGILSIVLMLVVGSIAPLIIGWIHANKWDIRGIMIIWTITTIALVVVAMVGAIFMIMTGALMIDAASTAQAAAL